MIYSYKRKSNIPRNSKFVVECFLIGDTHKTRNFRSTGEQLYHYNTALAQHTDDGIIYNCTKYSQVTSKTQYTIREYLNPKDPIYLTTPDVPLGAGDLSLYLADNKISDAMFIDKMGKRVKVVSTFGNEFVGIVTSISPTHVTLTDLWKSFTPIVNSHDPTKKTVIHRMNIKEVKKFNERNRKN